MNADSQRFDTKAATWDEDPRRVNLARDLFRAIGEVVTLTPDMHALDFGCGTGLVTLPLAARVGRVTGVDSSQGMLDILKDKIGSYAVSNVEIRRVDLENGDVLDGRYDLIVTTMTLHHVRDVPALLNAFARVLNANGRVCIADLDTENGDFHGDNAGVFHLGFDREILKRSLAEAGFVECSDTTAAEVSKPVADAALKTFSIFLVTARREGVVAQ